MIMMIIMITMVVSHEFCHSICITYATLTHLLWFSTQTRFWLGHWPKSATQPLKSATRRHVLSNKTSKTFWFLTTEAGCTCWILLVCLGGGVDWGGEIRGMEQNDPKTHSNNKTQNLRQHNTTMDTLLLRVADSRRDIPGWLESYCKLLYFQCPPWKLGMRSS